MTSVPSPATPRTDAEGVRFARIMIEWTKPHDQQVTELVPADFARQLERELAAATRLSSADRFLSVEVTPEMGFMAWRAFDPEGRILLDSPEGGEFKRKMNAAIKAALEVRLASSTTESSGWKQLPDGETIGSAELHTSVVPARVAFLGINGRYWVYDVPMIPAESMDDDVRISSAKRESRVGPTIDGFVHYKSAPEPK